MLESMAWLSGLIADYPSYAYVIVFLGAAFGGEPGVIALSFLAAQGMFPLPPFILASFLGVFASDCLYFFLGKTRIIHKVIEHRYAAKTISVIVEAIERLSKGRHMVAFILAKFVIGTRAVIIMYVSKTGLTFGYFIRQNIVAIVSWLAIVVSIGYVAGLGFSYVSKILENVYAGLGFLLLFILVIFIVQAQLKKTFAKEEAEIMKGKDMV